MEEEIGQSRYEEILGGFSGCSVLVVGDLMVDEYLRGVARRISPESPVMVVEVEADEFKPGGAANVGANLRALGAHVSMAGVVGDDDIGNQLREELASWKVDIAGIFTDPSRPTTRKTRIVAQNQQVLRVDREQTHPVSEAVSGQILAYARALLGEIDAILISDYRKGVLTPVLAESAIAQARAAGKPLVTNPKPGSAPWLRGASVLSLNQAEAEELSRERLPENDADLRAFGARLLHELDLETLVITRGSRGLCYWKREGEYRFVSAHKVEVYDTAGAGDTTISAMTLALLCGADTREAAEIANRAGACVVRKSGVATVTVEELLHFTR